MNLNMVSIGRMLLVLLLIAVFFGLFLKDPNHAFCTEATYVAPDTGFELKLLGSGIVKAGDDLSEDHIAVAMICPLTGSGNPMRLVRRGPVTAEYFAKEGATGVLNWTHKTKSKILEPIFQTAGFQLISDPELAETMRVFLSVSFGEKSTIMPGQTRFLKVKSVEFHRSACGTETHNQWMEKVSSKLGC